MEMMARLRESIPGLSEKENFNIREGIFPLRPLVYGGDDITFVCDARIGLSAAAYYLERFSEKEVNLPSGTAYNLTACAGVTLAPLKFPFARAYRLAEALCGSAKARRLEYAGMHGNDGGSWIDFQVIYGSGGTNLASIRQRQFMTVTGESLLYRPWQVTGCRESELGWRHLMEGVRYFREDWPRSHAKNLKEALTEGQDATSGFLAFQRSRGRVLPSAGAWHQACKKGWIGKKTPYFDCLEIMDTCLDIEPREEE
jgi:hypothetical protein